MLDGIFMSDQISMPIIRLGFYCILCQVNAKNNNYKKKVLVELFFMKKENFHIVAIVPLKMFEP